MLLRVRGLRTILVSFSFGVCSLCALRLLVFPGKSTTPHTQMAPHTLTQLENPRKVPSVIEIRSSETMLSSPSCRPWSLVCPALPIQLYMTLCALQNPPMPISSSLFIALRCPLPSLPPPRSPFCLRLAPSIRVTTRPRQSARGPRKGDRTARRRLACHPALSSGFGPQPHPSFCVGCKRISAARFPLPS